jgi:hypothetical protein
MVPDILTIDPRTEDATLDRQQRNRYRVNHDLYRTAGSSTFGKVVLQFLH